MAMPAAGLNLANLEKSCIPLDLDCKGVSDEIPIYRDRATGKVVAIYLNQAMSVVCGLSPESTKNRLNELFNTNQELKQVKCI